MKKGLRRGSSFLVITKSKRRFFSTSSLSSDGSSSGSHSEGLWNHLELAPFDSNHETAQAFEADKSGNKINLGRGVYKDDKGKDWVLPSVALAVSKLVPANGAPKIKFDYLPFSGLPEFCKETRKFLFGPTGVVSEGRVATVQSISGTGALRVGAEFLARFLPEDPELSNKHIPRTVYLPDPTYVNHFPIFMNNSFKVKRYRYYNSKNCNLDINGLLEDVSNAPKNSLFLFHACAHNPTGVDPSMEQWKQISDACLKKQHIIFFDSAYQGFASGDSDKDAAAVRHFVDQNHKGLLVAQSYAKNMGLYGQRVGALNIITDSEKQTKIVMSQLNQVIRPMYSNPPGFGAQIVTTIFTDEECRQMWLKDVKTMADRIKAMRTTLVHKLASLGSTRNWDHISNQIGMFAYSGLKESEVKSLRTNSVYMNYDGRMSMTGVNSSNVDHLASAIHDVTK